VNGVLEKAAVSIASAKEGTWERLPNEDLTFGGEVKLRDVFVLFKKDGLLLKKLS
jgi:hypothetical protein